jgi:hypothetical protein
LDGPGFLSWQGQEIFLFSEKSIPAVGPTSGYRASVGGGIKGSGCDFDHLASSNAEDKNELSYTYTAPVHLHGVDIDRYTFYHSSIYLYEAELHFR